MTTKSISAETLFAQMDKFSQAKEPFLFAIDYEMQEAYFIPNPIEQEEIRFCIHGKGNATNEKNPDKAYTFKAFPESYEQYLKRFEVIHKAEIDGNSFLANLTIATPIHCSLQLNEIYDYAKAPYKLHIPKRLVCYSPEAFVHITQDGKISSYPMKGTIDATIPNAAKILQNDYKEKSEHYTIVDLIRNDLSKVSKHVRVDRFGYLDKIITTDSQILQMSSEISGQLSTEDMNRLGNVISQLLPAGSISGAPKEATCHAIREAEQRERGFYSGVFGYYDGKTLDSAVMIRYIEQVDQTMDEEEASSQSSEQTPMFRFHSGGGITIHSKPEDEYNEVLQKVYLPF